MLSHPHKQYNSIRLTVMFGFRNVVPVKFERNSSVCETTSPDCKSIIDAVT